MNDRVAFWLARLECEDVLLKASPPARRVFVALAKRALMPDGYVFPSVRTLCRESRLKKRAVFKGLSELIELGVLFRRRMVDRDRGRTIPSMYRLGCEVQEIPGRCKWKAVLAVENPATEPRNRCARSKSQVSSLGMGARCTKLAPGEGAKNVHVGGAKNVHPRSKRREVRRRGVSVSQSVKSVSPRKSRKALRRTAKRKPQRKPFSFFWGPDGLTDLTQDSSQEKNA